MIDVDRNATSPLHPAARAAMAPLLLDGGAHAFGGNPSSVHRHGQRARAVVEDARRAVAQAVGASAAEVVFTSGGTEADGLALLGAARALRAAGRACGVACSAIEHPAVTGAAAMLRREGHTVATLAVDGRGCLDDDALREVLDDAAIGLVSVTAAHHELGNVTDLPALVATVRAVRPEVLVHTDAVQAFGRTALAFAQSGVDLLSLSAHKIGGPVGIGALVCARSVALAPLWGGGAQQAGRRPGTESALLAAGFGAAATACVAELPAYAREVRPLGERLRAGLLALGAELYGDRERHLGNTALVGFDGCDGHLVMIALDVAGFACSTGAACSSGTVEPSPVLLALGRDRVAARGALRLSLGHGHTAADVDALLAALPEVLARVRAAGMEASA